VFGQYTGNVALWCVGKKKFWTKSWTSLIFRCWRADSVWLSADKTVEFRWSWWLLPSSDPFFGKDGSDWQAASEAKSKWSQGSDI